MCFSCSFHNATIAPFKYKNKLESIPAEEYRIKNILLETGHPIAILLLH